MTSVIRGDDNFDSKPSLFFSTTVAVATTSIIIPSLDISTHKSYRIEIEAIDSAAGADAEYRMYANNNLTETNYYSQYLNADSTSVSGARTNTAAVGFASNGGYSVIVGNIVLVGGFPAAIFNNAKNIGAGIAVVQYSWSHTINIGNLTQLQLSSTVANGFGDYTVNLINAMPDTNYCVAVSTSATSYAPVLMVNSALTVSSCRLQDYADTVGTRDVTQACAALFR